mmetsp:Transcript_32161/g.70063  ORF Transcript_32161/g.70063 Transcript_32161/m.70063 type:complete len:138 (-) Transcript_32161:1227-1640(-)
MAEKQDFSTFINELLETAYNRHCLENYSHATTSGKTPEVRQSSSGTVKTQWNLHFRYPFNKNFSLRQILEGLLELKDSEDQSNLFRDAIQKLTSRRDGRNMQMLDEKDLDLCEADEQQVTSSFPNLYKAIGYKNPNS